MENRSAVKRNAEMKERYRQQGWVRVRVDVWAHPNAVDELQGLRTKMQDVAKESRETALQVKT